MKSDCVMFIALISIKINRCTRCCYDTFTIRFVFLYIQLDNDCHCPRGKLLPKRVWPDFLTLNMQLRVMTLTVTVTVVWCLLKTFVTWLLVVVSPSSLSEANIFLEFITHFALTSLPLLLYDCTNLVDFDIIHAVSSSDLCIYSHTSPVNYKLVSEYNLHWIVACKMVSVISSTCSSDWTEYIPWEIHSNPSFNEHKCVF